MGSTAESPILAALAERREQVITVDTKCRLGQVLATQPQEVVEAITEALDDRKVFPNDTLRAIINKSLETSVGDSTFRSHRNGTCGCFS